jgi:hypothetical protein
MKTVFAKPSTIRRDWYVVDAAEQKSADVSQHQPTVVVVNDNPQQETPMQAPLLPHHLGHTDVSNTDTGDDPGVFVPPLQAKIEILKKSQGIDNVYDENSDDLSRIKTIAGLTPAQQIAADDDEPFDG